MHTRAERKSCGECTNTHPRAHHAPLLSVKVGLTHGGTGARGPAGLEKHKHVPVSIPSVEPDVKTSHTEVTENMGPRNAGKGATERGQAASY